MTDNRMIIATVVGTGIAMTTVIVTFVGIIAGGINNRIGDVNDGIDDVNATVNNRIGDLNSRFDDMNDSVNTRFDDVNRRIDNINANLNRRSDDMQNGMRELRALVIDAIKGADPAENG